MSEVIVWCGIYDEGTIFPIRIQSNASVNALKIAIVKEMMNVNHRLNINPATLNLYFPKKKNKVGIWTQEWLKQDEKVISWLREGRQEDDINEEMMPNWNLQDYLGEKLDLKSCYILLKLPQGGSTIANNASLAPNSTIPLDQLPRNHIEDYTSAWLAEFQNHQILPAALPLVNQLESFITSDLPVKINILQGNFDQMIEFSESESLVKKIFQTNNSKPCTDLFCHLHRVFHPLAAGKHSFITYWDETIRTGLDIVLRHVATFDRDSATCSSTGLQRPSFIYLVDAVCVFRGVEKNSNFQLLHTLRDELVDKLVWIYGDAPYLFGYTAVGYHVELYAITNALTTIKLGYYNIEKPFGRLTLLLAILQISRLFQSIAKLTPDRAKGEYWWLSRANGVLVHFQGMYVLKQFGNRENYLQAKVHALQVYTMMDVNQVPNRDRLKHCDDEKMALVLHPRGDQQIPQSLAELFRALSNVLECLVVLHAASWMHRDIRWDNLIKSREVDDLWFLIDFIDSAQSPQPLYTGIHFSRNHHAPEIFKNDTHDTAVDVWAVGHLIEDTDLYCDGWRSSRERCHFSDSLLQEDPNLRPTAVGALEQLKILENDYLTKHKPKQSGPRYTKAKRSRERLSYVHA